MQPAFLWCSGAKNQIRRPKHGLRTPSSFTGNGYAKKMSLPVLYQALQLLMLPQRQFQTLHRQSLQVAEKTKRQRKQKSIPNDRVRAFFVSAPQIYLSSEDPPVTVVRLQARTLNCGNLGWVYWHPASGRHYLLALDHRTLAVRKIARWLPRQSR